MSHAASFSDQFDSWTQNQERRSSELQTREKQQPLTQRLAVARWSKKLRGLRMQLIVPHVLLTLMIAMVGVFVVTRLVTSSIQERFVNQLFEASRVAADGIVRRERIHLEDLRLMAFTEGVSEAMASRDTQGLQNLLWPLMLNSKVEAVTAVDQQGQELLTLVRDPETGEYITLQGRDFSQLDLVVKVLDGDSDGVGDKFVAIVDTTFGPYMFTSAPIRTADGQLIGTLMLGVRLETLLAELKAQSLADIVLADLNGKVVVATLVEPEEGYGALEMDPSEVSDPDLSMTRELSLYNRDFQAVYAPLVLRQHTIGVLGVVLPSNYLLSTGATSRTMFSLIFSLGTVAIIVVGYRLSESIARPILRLRSISQAVAAGDLDQSTGLRRTDEIGELAYAFDSMTLRLRERTAEAARLYDESGQRNQELAEINARLQDTQAQLIQSEKLGAVGQLTAGIVHDVKNPLAVIKGLAEELDEEIGADATIGERLNTIRSSAARANTIVTDLLKFARQSTPELKTRDMRETIETALRMTEYLARKGGIEVVADLPAIPVMSTYDAQQIEQVLINLIQNAIQAMPDGGTLRINLSQAEGALAISVQDSGFGIGPDSLKRIFDPFFTTKPEGEGTGLGLSVSYGIVTRHGGRIEVESAPGAGTIFTISLSAELPDPAG